MSFKSPLLLQRAFLMPEFHSVIQGHRETGCPIFMHKKERCKMKNVKTMALALAAGVGRGFPDFEKVRKFCSADFSKSAQKVRKTGMKKGTV